jgi:hypothetical protein
VYAAFGDNTVRALDLQSGALRWRERLDAVDQRTGSPAVTDDAVYTLDLIGHLSRFAPATGERVWDFAINERVFRSPVVVAGEHVLAATGQGRLVAVDPDNGHMVWQSDATGFPLRALTPTPDLIVAVRGGPQAGLVAYRHDDDGALVDVVSPTVFNAGTFAQNLGLAVLPILVMTILIGRFLSARMGPAFIVEDDGEPVDPWASDDEDPA